MTSNNDLLANVESLLIDLDGKLECVQLSLRDIVFAQPGDAELVAYHGTLNGAANILKDAMKTALEEFDEAAARSRSSASSKAEEVPNV